MKAKRNQEKTSSSDLVLGDVIEIAGMRCTVVKIESIFYYRPDAKLRFELRSEDYLGKGADVTVFFGHHVPLMKLKK